MDRHALEPEGEPAPTFRHLLRRHRRAGDLTQAALAARAGQCVRTVTVVFAAVVIVGCMALLQPNPLRAGADGAAKLVHRHSGRGATTTSTRCKTRDRPAGTLKLVEENYFTTLNPNQNANPTQLTNAMFDDLFRYDNRAR